jgi:DNA anti-recombination protein RmuC
MQQNNDSTSHEISVLKQEIDQLTEDLSNQIISSKDSINQTISEKTQGISKDLSDIRD